MGGALGPNSGVEGRVAENLYLLFSAGPSVDVLCSRSALPSPIGGTNMNPLSLYTIMLSLILCRSCEHDRSIEGPAENAS